jgi:hypothetical protein
MTVGLVTVGDRVAKIEKDRKRAHILREVRTLEIDNCSTSLTRYGCARTIAPLRAAAKDKKLCDRATLGLRLLLIYAHVFRCR